MSIEVGEIYYLKKKEQYWLCTGNFLSRYFENEKFYYTGYCSPYNINDENFDYNSEWNFKIDDIIISLASIYNIPENEIDLDNMIPVTKISENLLNEIKNKNKELCKNDPVDV